MVAAVVRLEWMRNARREMRVRQDRLHPLLSCYVFCLVVDCCAFYIRMISGGDCIFLPPLPGRSGRFIADAVAFVWLQQWLLPLLLAPPFVASAFAGDRANGMLQLLFTTPLTSGELILGKFLGRIAPLVLLGLAHWPFWGLLAGLLGLDPLSAAILAGATLLPVLAVSAISLLASVWCRKSADAVVALYVLFGVGFVMIWSLDAGAASFSPGWSWLAVVSDALAPFRPDYLLKPIWDGRGRSVELGRQVLTATAAWGSVVVGCLGLACWRLRSAAMDRPEIRGNRPSRKRPAVDDEPIRWKECYRERRMPLVLFRAIPTSLALLGVFVGTAWLFLRNRWPSEVSIAKLMECLWTGDFELLSNLLDSRAQPGGLGVGLALLKGLGMLLLAALTIAVRCATAVTGEREHGTWEMLLLTPLSTRELIQGKVRGILRSARPYLAVYALAAVPCAWLGGQGELLVTLGTLLLAGPIMLVAGAIGIYQSARAANSWRSILDTVGFLIVAGLVTALVSNFVVGCLGLAILGLASILENLTISSPCLDWLGMEGRYQGGFCFLLAIGSLWIAFCWQASREFLAKAEKWVDDFERTPRSELSARTAGSG